MIATNQPSLYVMKDVVAVLDQETTDVYPVDVRVRLAACAIRLGGFGRTNARKVDGAVAWLRQVGHIV